MTAKLERRVLVLNRNWMPMNVTTVFDAVCDVYVGRALFVDPLTYATHDFESWVNTWKDAIDQSRVEVDRVIATSKHGVVAPEIISYLEYKGMGLPKTGRRQPKFSRRNVFSRDRNTCQYCGRTFSSENLNLDHVVPKSRGGQMTWENIVLSCIPCNTRKGSHTPKEANMSLVRTPYCPTAKQLYQPTPERLFQRFGRDVPVSWEMFLGKMYWDVELRD